MQSNVQIDHNRASFTQHNQIGNAFAFNKKTELALCGGLKFTYLYDLTNQQAKLLKIIDINWPKKWLVNNYDWNSQDASKYLQTRDKIIELIDVETQQVLRSLHGHSRLISESKWSCHSSSLLASCSMDSYIYVWNAECNRPVCIIDSIGELNCLVWLKTKENTFAVSLNNDIKIYDLRKPNNVLNYITNAHSKLIYSLDCSANKDCLLSCGRDRVMRLWHLSMNDKNNPSAQIKLDDMPCWKAKFTTHANFFGVIPVAQTPTQTQLFSPTPLELTYQQQQQQQQTTACDFFFCNINSSQEIKPYKYTSDKHDMMLDFDFSLQNDRTSFVAWTKDNTLIQCLVDVTHMPQNVNKPLNDDESRLPTILNINQLVAQQIPQTSITTNSSRKSSFSEHGGYGTPPNLNYFPVQQVGDDSMTPLVVNAQIFKAATHTRNVDNVPYPKLFGAKFSGLPENFLIYKNNSLSSGQASTLPHNYTCQTNDKTKSKSLKIAKLQKVRSMSKQMSVNNPLTRHEDACVYVYDITALVNIRYDLATNYFDNTNTNIKMMSKEVGKIFDLIETITRIDDTQYASLNPDHGRPWACSSFGRDLVNYLIDSCMKIDDLQTIVMILCKCIRHDSSIVPNASTLNRRDRKKQTTHNNSRQSSNILYESLTDTRLSDDFDCMSDDCLIRKHSKNLGLLDLERINEFDSLIKAYCDILFKWGFFLKRAELYEFIRDKPANMDKKFVFSLKCLNCGFKTNDSRCSNKSCMPYSLYCSLCQFPVKGLSMCCYVCGHGGHFDHLSEWFKENFDCPAACGCKCIFYV